MSYDPDPRRKHKGKEPPQLKRWRLAHKPKYDPAPGYRSSFWKGPRGGHYFQGPRKRRYDPTRNLTSRVGSARRRSYGYGGAGYARGPFGKVEQMAAKWGILIGALLGFGVPEYQAYQVAQNTPEHPEWKKANFMEFVRHGWDNETKLFKKDPSKQLQYKFMNTESHWCLPFWISLIVFILSYMKVLPQRINRIAQPIATGALIGTTIGGLTQFGTSSYNGNSITMQRGNDGTYQIPLETSNYYA